MQYELELLHGFIFCGEKRFLSFLPIGREKLKSSTAWLRKEVGWPDIIESDKGRGHLSLRPPVAASPDQ